MLLPLLRTATSILSATTTCTTATIPHRRRATALRCCTSSTVKFEKNCQKGRLNVHGNIIDVMKIVSVTEGQSEPTEHFKEKAGRSRTIATAPCRAITIMRGAIDVERRPSNATAYKIDRDVHSHIARIPVGDLRIDWHL